MKAAQISAQQEKEHKEREEAERVKAAKAKEQEEKERKQKMEEEDFLPETHQLLPILENHLEKKDNR